MSLSLYYRRLAADSPGSVLLETSLAGAGPSYFFTEPEEWVEAHTLAELPGLFAKLREAQARGLWATGYLSYECGYVWEPKAAPGWQPQPGGLPLAAFGLYVQPSVFASGLPVAEPVSLDPPALAISQEAFAEKVAAIHRWIERGDTYQVNLTDCLRAGFTGHPSLLFSQMMAAQPVAFGAMLRVGERCILSASPELFFEQQGRSITVRPMKGTAPRGRDAAEDREQIEWLAADPKNRAENLMIVDLLRNDLGRIAEPGSVTVQSLFAVERYPSLLQMTSEITATLRPEVGAEQVFASLFPSGSIVGAPKVRTMQIVRELEGRERGVYTGSIGYFAPDGRAVFSVAIRTAVLDREGLQMGVGAGITYDSDAAQEYAECALKGRFLSETPFSLIETMRWENGRCGLLPRHLARLASSAGYFGFACDREQIAARLTGEFGNQPATLRVRLLLARDGSVTVTHTLLVDEPGPFRALLWPEPVHSGDCFLRHKTTRRLLYDRAYKAVREQGLVDALFLNERGELAEGAIHNVLVRHGQRWCTPPLAAGALPGVYRAHLLATMPALEQSSVTPEELLAADEVLVCNAVRGARRVEVVAAS